VVKYVNPAEVADVFEALAEAYDHDEHLTVRGLNHVTGVNRGTAVRVLRALEDRGWVSATEAPRGWPYWSLTDAGRDAVEDVLSRPRPVFRRPGLAPVGRRYIPGAPDSPTWRFTPLGVNVLEALLLAHDQGYGMLAQHIAEVSSANHSAVLHWLGKLDAAGWTAHQDRTSGTARRNRWYYLTGWGADQARRMLAGPLDQYWGYRPIRPERASRFNALAYVTR
jgi:DNA-binding PadR family transcriptional regulator